MSDNANGCGCTKELKLVFSCSGAADTGEVCDRSARQLNRAQEAKMYCLTGVGGRVPDIMENTKAASTILAMDGCPKDCARKALLEAGIENFKHLRVTDLGLKKGSSPATDETIALVVGKASEMLQA